MGPINSLAACSMFNRVIHKYGQYSRDIGHRERAILHKYYNTCWRFRRHYFKLLKPKCCAKVVGCVGTSTVYYSTCWTILWHLLIIKTPKNDVTSYYFGESN